MNYNRFLKKRNKLIDDIKNSFIQNTSDYEVKYIKVSERYKDEVLNILLVKGVYNIIFYVQIDLIKLEVINTIFDYSIYKSNKNIRRDEIKYDELEGNNIDTKVQSLIGIIEKQMQVMN
jgi:hypothetical protein